MLTLLSPAKTQDFSMNALANATQIHCQEEAATLIHLLKQDSVTDLMQRMSISKKIAELNLKRYQDFQSKNYSDPQAKPAIQVFQGDAYQALDSTSLSPQAIAFLQQHLVILSGLYGYLKPLDLIQAYRLEMKTKLQNPMGKDLYAFWNTKISQYLNDTLKNHRTPYLIHLASQEYYQAIDQKTLKYPVIHIEFKERKKNNTYQTVAIHAKRARGLMVRFIAENAIDDPLQLQAFTAADYHFKADLSKPDRFIFHRY